MSGRRDVSAYGRGAALLEAGFVPRAALLAQLGVDGFEFGDLVARGRVEYANAGRGVKLYRLRGAR